MEIQKRSGDSSPDSIDNIVMAARKKFPAGPRQPGVAVALDSDAGARHIFGAFGVHWKIDSADSGGRFSVLHHPIAPRSLVAPLHRHHREDEYSYVLTGKLGALLGEEVVTAGPGTWVFKPRGQWHTFWNAGDIHCEISKSFRLADSKTSSASSRPHGATRNRCQRWAPSMSSTSISKAFRSSVSASD
jgi:mannose-6-phosphate isomerase-like protein (cupin superfamily)